MNKLFFIMYSLVALALCSCGRSTEIAPEFQAYADAFNAAAKAQNSDKTANVIIQFGEGEFTTDEQAHCSKPPFSTPRIAVNKPAWTGLSDIQKKILIFHELGHCVLDRDHKDGDAPADQLTRPYAGIQLPPASIMNSKANLAATFYEVEHVYYDKELFSAN